MLQSAGAMLQRPGTTLVVVIAVATLLAGCGSNATSQSQTSTSTVANAQTVTSPGPIDPKAIPLGDGYVSTSPKVGYVDSCVTNFAIGIGGSDVEGPWFDTTTKTWNSITKLAVEGSVTWTNARYKVTLGNGRRLVTTNDLPINHTTGRFPIALTDPAYKYDRNPNTITVQSINWSLPEKPTAATQPSCTGLGPIGVLNDGVVLFNALDGEGRDAGAHETLDIYQGHPQMAGFYHHHAVPSQMIDKATGTSTLIGYATDGYGIYVERDADGTLLTNTQLDACHGRTSKVLWNGKEKVVYHYDATLEYPYTIGCFHGTHI